MFGYMHSIQKFYPLASTHIGAGIFRWGLWRVSWRMLIAMFKINHKNEHFLAIQNWMMLWTDRHKTITSWSFCMIMYFCMLRICDAKFDCVYDNFFGLVHLVQRESVSIIIKWDSNCLHRWKLPAQTRLCIYLLFVLFSFVNWFSVLLCRFVKRRKNL